jgi:futalosine hydrolase
MSIGILLVIATDTEAEALRRIPGIISTTHGYSFGKCEITSIVTGVGPIATSWALTKWFSVNQKPDLALNIGIAGSFREDIKIGDVVIPVSDRFAGSGVEPGNEFITPAEAGSEDTAGYLFKEGKIWAENKYIELNLSHLKHVNAITVNAASGSADTIKKISEKYNPDIETMEGATFFYICGRAKIPFLAMRSISNKVEPRDKDKWNIPLALKSLSEELREFILTLE